jgi:hypothetical protein
MITAKTLIPARYVVSATEVQYTAVGNRVIVDKMTATNNANSPVEISVFIVPSGGQTTNAEHRLINRREIAARGTWLCPEIAGHVLEPNDKIVTQASVGGSITLRASGREIG